MRVKPLILTGFVVAALSCATAVEHVYAADGYSEAPIVLAQNDQGFFGRLFNKSHDSSDSKPLFLNKGADNPLSGSKKVTPFTNYSTKQSSKDSDKAWEEYKKGLKQQLAENAKVAQDYMAYDKAQVDAAQAQFDAQGASGSRTGVSTSSSASSSSSGRMVYDPHKVWIYMPGQNKQSNTTTNTQQEETARPRIYNRR